MDKAEQERMLKCRRDVEATLEKTFAELQPKLAEKYGANVGPIHTAICGALVRVACTMTLTRAHTAHIPGEIDRLCDRMMDMLKCAIPVYLPPGPPDAPSRN